MKTLNASAKTSIVRPVYDDDGKQPCWYAEVEREENSKDNKWRVGVVHPDGKKDEFSFKFSKVGKGKDSIERAGTGEFGIQVLDKFKEGGEKAVKEWLAQGCP